VQRKRGNGGTAEGTNPKHKASSGCDADKRQASEPKEILRKETFVRGRDGGLDVSLAGSRRQSRSGRISWRRRNFCASERLVGLRSFRFCCAGCDWRRSIFGFGFSEREGLLGDRIGCGGGGDLFPASVDENG